MSGRVWRRFRGARAIAAAGGLLIPAALAGAGLAVAASGPGPTQLVNVSLPYACHFLSGGSSSGGFTANILVHATFPRSIAAGQEIQPTGVTITATLPNAVVDQLHGTGAAEVTGADALSVTESYLGTSTKATWSAHTLSAASLPQSGSLVLAGPGAAPAVTASKAGTAIFSAGGLVLTLDLATSDGSAASPPTMQAGCATSSAAQLATVAVPTASSSPSPSRSGSSSPPVNQRNKIKFPPGCGKIKERGAGVATCGYITGFSDVAKAFGAALLQPRPPAKPGLVNLDFAERHVLKKKELIEYSTAELYYHGRHELPPITATLLGFRFVPVKATLRLIELTPIKIVSVSGITAPPYPITVHATTTISIRITNVTVNGVPLNVGPSCRTAAPTKLTLVGKGDNTLPPRGYTVPTGGPLSGMVTIPRFTGCGTSENLDTLFTGSISGPGNFVKMTQGKLCGPSQPQNWTCPPPAPKPIR